jgi:hypothetical protein
VLITAVATVTATLEAVRYPAQRTSSDRVAEFRRQAYAGLVTAAYSTADFFGARPRMLPVQYDEAVRVDLNGRIDYLIAAVNQAVAVVQIVGSRSAADQAAYLANTAPGQSPATSAGVTSVHAGRLS